MDDLSLSLALILGPNFEGAPPEAVLERGWRVYRSTFMKPHPVLGVRPWAHWRFDLGEPEPEDRDDRIVRLAELGELRGDEIRELRERAANAQQRLDTLKNIDVAEHERAVRLWRTVERVLDALVDT